MAIPSGDKIMDLRVEQMVSLSPTAGKEPIFRVAQFLAPSVTSIESAYVDLEKNSSTSGHGDDKNLNGDNLKVNFPGWRTPRLDWNTWVHRMQSRHGSVWKQAGIYNAVMNSPFRIHRNEALIFAFSERWCPDTNTFLFPWGEATITLEDLTIIGGFPVLGDPVFSPIPESEEFMKKLLSARKEIQSTKARKASQGPWLHKFMDSGSEVEHEAFLALWLSRFVFPTKSTGDTIGKHVLPIAIHLARGTKIALAPAVLANVYANLTEMKRALSFSSHNKQESPLEISISAPFELVQIWVWERFANLQPKPISVGNDLPRFARWHDSRMNNSGDIKLAIDEAAHYFHWRPYTVPTEGIYGDNAVWTSVGAGLSEKQEILVRWLRVSELVGTEPNCIEKYLPHRVAMQFGFDQDVPGHVARANSSRTTAWENYDRKINDETLCVPSHFFVSDVTTRYKEWWKKYVSSLSDDAIITDMSRVSHKGLKRKMLQTSVLKQLPSTASNLVRGSGFQYRKEDETAALEQSSGERLLASASNGNKSSPHEPLFPPGFPPKPQHMAIRDSKDSYRSDGKSKGPNMIRLTGAEYKKTIATPLRPCRLGKGLQLNSGDDDTVPPGFQPKGIQCGRKDPQEDNLVEVPISVMVENAALQKVKEEPMELISENEKDSSKAVQHGAESSRPGGSGLESGNSETPLCHQPLSSGSANLTKAGYTEDEESDRKTKNRKCSCSDDFKDLANKLEARITKLERIVASEKSKQAAAADDDDDEGSL